MEKTLDPWVVWRPFGDDEVTLVLPRLSDRAPQFLVGSGLAGAQCSDLSFYGSHLLIELRFDSSRGLERVFGLHGPDETRWLDGTSGPIHETNAAESLQLTEATAHDYLRFFLYFVHGDSGAFALIESEDELFPAEGGAASPTDDNGSSAAASEVQARLMNARSRATPLTTRAVDEQGRWIVDTSVAYEGSLFAVTMAVAANGEVEMLEDEQVELLDGIATPEHPSLDLHAIPESAAEPHDEGDGDDFLDKLRGANLIDTPTEELARDRDVTEAIVAVLLEDAFGALDPEEAGSNMLVGHFNPLAAGDTPIALLSRLVAGSMPVIILESDIPFVEDFVAGLVDGPSQAITGGAISRAGASPSDELRCWIDLDQTLATKLHLLSFHAYRGLYDQERTAHELAIRDCAVLIGCVRSADVPEPLRRIADLVLSFPRIDRHRFVRIFQRVFHAVPTPGWDAPGADWTRYLVPADFHLPRRLRTSPDDALLFLKARVEARLTELTPDIGPKLSELHGLGEARQICEDIVADIHAAQAGQIPWSAVDKGVLLVGAPGTGKTTLARALAKECGIKFIVASAAGWQSAGYLDSHLRAMRADFAEARRYAPAILFIDEFDSIGSREQLEGDRAATYQTDVINALLEQIQGIDTVDPVVVIGATNYGAKIDPALRRPGRLDQVVELPLPNIAALEQIFDYYLTPHRKAKHVARDVETRTLAELTWGGTGADVEFFVRGADRRARRAGRKIRQEDLLAEVTRRPRRPDSVPQPGKDELRRVAVHEAGHAVARLLSSTNGEDVTFVTIVPRLDGSLGFVATAPLEGHLYTRRTLLERLETVLAGRAAEELVYGTADIGAGAGGPSETSDLAVATRLSELIVCQSGLGDDDALHWTSKPTPAQVKQIGAMLSKSYRNIVERLEVHRELLDRLVEVLVEKQELSGAELRELFGETEATRVLTK